MLGDAYADGLIDHNPMARIRSLKSTSDRDPDPFTPDEVSRILAACDGPMRNLLQFAFATGLRRTELLGLRWCDIDLDSGTAYIHRSVIKGHEEERTKTRSGRREMTLLPMAMSALQQQAQYSYLTGERVFMEPLSCQPWQSSKQLARRWTRILRLAKVRYRNPYQTRHTYASMLPPQVSIRCGSPSRWATKIGECYVVCMVDGLPMLSPTPGQKQPKR